MAKKRELDQKQEKNVTLFDFINDISCDKRYLLNDDTIGAYNAFMVNRGLSQHMDTILLANEMNKRSGVTDEMHHDFLFFAVDSKKRYGKWAKKTETDAEVINHIRLQYNIGPERAIEYFNLMSDDEKDQIEKLLKSKGGRK
jgi:hypothetical protein